MRAQRLPWVLLATLMGGVLSVIVPDLALPVPSLSGASAFGAIRSFALIALLVTIVTWTGAAFGHKAPVLASVRRISAYGATALVGLVVVSAAAVAATQTIVGATATPGWLLVRDLGGFLSLGVILLPWTGYRYAGIVPTVYVFGAAVFGREYSPEGEQTALWAWPISESTAAAYWLPPLILAAIALIVTIVRLYAAPSRFVIAQALDTRRE